MKPLIIAIFLVFTIISAQDLFTDQPVQSLDDAIELLRRVREYKAEVQNLLNEFSLNMNAMKGMLVPAVKEDIKWSGISLGNRWRINEEGTNSYEALVFRDQTTTNAGVDRRYAMYNQRYTDL